MTTDSKQFILEVEEDPVTGDGVLTFTPEILEIAGWKEGDLLEWNDNGDGSWTLKRKI